MKSKLIEDENCEPSSNPELSQLCRPCQQESLRKAQQGREVRPTYCCLLQTLSLQWQALKYTFLLHYLSFRIQLSQNFNGTKITFYYILLSSCWWYQFLISWRHWGTSNLHIISNLRVTVGTATTPGLQRAPWRLQCTSDLDFPFFYAFKIKIRLLTEEEWPAKAPRECNVQAILSVKICLSELINT